MLHRSNGDVRIFQPPVVLWIPATVLDKIPGVGLGAAGSGHAPDRHLQLSLPKLWHGRPSALQPESPGLCPCCRQRGVHPLPESHWAQVGRWVLISAHGGYLFQIKDILKGSTLLLLKCWKDSLICGGAEGDDGYVIWICLSGSLDKAQRRNKEAAEGLKHLKLVWELKHTGFRSPWLHLISFQLRLLNSSSMPKE